MVLKKGLGSLGLGLAGLLLVGGCGGSSIGDGNQVGVRDVFAVNGQGSLVSFSRITPSFVSTIGNITGLQGGEKILGMDFRPANGLLYALGSTGRIYTINTTTGAASIVGNGPISVALNPTATGYGFDFNPAVDRIRITNSAGQNIRVNPNDGLVVDGNPDLGGVQPDGNLSYDANDQNNNTQPQIVGSAYTNNVAGATSTTLFNLDAGTNRLVRQGAVPPALPGPNSGTLFTINGATNVDITPNTSFDISSNGSAFATTTTGQQTSLYSVNLTNGAFTLIGQLNSDSPINAIALSP
ncbi:MAG TPA: DUF4394 domain-containing protein [Abditibacteriaceae bacterium]|jgi:hypothetical protein